MNEIMLEIERKDNYTIIKNIKFFDLIKTLDSGQTFRYEKVYDSFDKEVVKGVYVCSKDIVTYMEMEKNKDKTSNLIIYSLEENIVNYWINFFNLKIDYENINKKIIKIDNSMKEVIKFSDGVRIIHMDLWESILTFIISANNNMTRIKNSVNMMSIRYGKLLKDLGEVKFYEIPRPDEVSLLTVSEIRELKVGFRDKYILDAAQRICTNEISIEKLLDLDAKEAKIELMKIKGIGDKVADCIRLFALNKFESFPVDVWIERYMLKYDLKDEIENIKIDRKYIESYGMDKYKSLAGFAQQYIFYYCIAKMKNEK